MNEAEAKDRETEGTKRKLKERARETKVVVEAFRSEYDGLREVIKELRIELKVEKYRNKVEIKKNDNVDGRNGINA